MTTTQAERLQLLGGEPCAVCRAITPAIDGLRMCGHILCDGCWRNRLTRGRHYVHMHGGDQ